MFFDLDECNAKQIKVFLIMFGFLLNLSPPKRFFIYTWIVPTIVAPLIFLVQALSLKALCSFGTIS